MEDAAAALDALISIAEFYSGNGALASLEMALQSKPVTQWKKPAKARTEFSVEDLKTGLRALEEETRAEDWGTLLEVSTQLQKGGVSWVPIVNGRLALSMVAIGPLLRDLGSAFDLAREALEAYPVDFAPYLTIAVLKYRVFQLDQALLWLGLAARCHQAPLYLISCVEKRMKFMHTKDPLKITTLPAILSPTMIKTLQTSDIEADWDAFNSSLLEIGSNEVFFKKALQKDFNLLKVTLAVKLAFDPDSVNFFAYDADKTPIAQLSPEDFEKLAQFLDLQSILKLRTTSRSMLFLSRQPRACQSTFANLYGLDSDSIPPQRERDIIPYAIHFVTNVVVDFMQSIGSPTDDETIWLEKNTKFLAIEPGVYPLLSGAKNWCIFAAMGKIAHLLAIDGDVGGTSMLDALESRFSIFEFLEAAIHEFPSMTNPFTIMFSLITYDGPRGEHYLKLVLEKGFFGSATRDLPNLPEARALHALIVSRDYWLNQPRARMPFWILRGDHELATADQMAEKKAALAAKLAGVWHFCLPNIAPLQAGNLDRGVFTLSLVEEEESSETGQKTRKNSKKGQKIVEIEEIEEDEEGEWAQEDDKAFILKLRGKGFSSLGCAEEASSVALEATLYYSGEEDQMRLVFWVPDHFEGGARYEMDCALAGSGFLCGAAAWIEGGEAPLPEAHEMDDFDDETTLTHSFIAWRDVRVHDSLDDEAIIQEVTQDIKKASALFHHTIEGIRERYPEDESRRDSIAMVAGITEVLRATLDGLEAISSWTPNTANIVESWLGELHEMCHTPEQLEEAASLQLLPAPLRGAAETENEFNLRLDVMRRFMMTLHMIRRSESQNSLLRDDAHGALMLLSQAPGDSDAEVPNTLSADSALAEPISRAMYIRWSQILMLTHDSLPNNNSILFEIIDALHHAIQVLHDDTLPEDDNVVFEDAEPGTEPRGYTRISHHSPEMKRARQGRRRAPSSSLAVAGTVALAGAAIAAITAGAYLLGRWLAPSKSQKK